jgi:hypothetical protein
MLDKYYSGSMLSILSSSRRREVSLTGHGVLLLESLWPESWVLAFLRTAPPWDRLRPRVCGGGVGGVRG